MKPASKVGGNRKEKKEKKKKVVLVEGLEAFSGVGNNIWVKMLVVDWINIVLKIFPFESIKVEKASGYNVNKYVPKARKHLTLNRPIQDPENRPIAGIALVSSPNIEKSDLSSVRCFIRIGYIPSSE